MKTSQGAGHIYVGTVSGTRGARGAEGSRVPRGDREHSLFGAASESLGLRVPAGAPRAAGAVRTRLT